MRGVDNMIRFSKFIDQSRFRSIFRCEELVKQVDSIELLFKIKRINGNEIDKDGAVRHGVMIWFGCKDFCNHYQVYWRKDSKLNGIYIGAQTKHNQLYGDGLVDRDLCAGQGYYPFDNDNWRQKIDTDIFDGGYRYHSLYILFDNLHTISVSADQNIILQRIHDKNEIFTTPNIGIRTDNVEVHVQLAANVRAIDKIKNIDGWEYSESD
jgi:hypothetical protein